MRYIYNTMTGVFLLLNNGRETNRAVSKPNQNEELMNRLDPKSRVYYNLKFSIQEFEQLSQAG